MDDLTIRFIDSYNYLKGEKFIDNDSDFAKKLDVSRSMVTEILKGRSNPGTKALQNIVRNFPIDATWILTGEGEMIKKSNNHADTHIANDGIDIQKEGVNANTPLSADGMSATNMEKSAPPTAPPTPFFSPKYVTINRDGTENILFVPIPAAAGYLNGYQDMVYLETLPAFNFPQLKNGTFRAFEVIGDSMFPTLENKEMVIGQYVEKLEYVREDRVHIVVTKKDGIVVKRLSNRIDKYGYIIAKSDAFDNRNSYQNFEIYPEDIIEIWYAVWHGKTSFKSPNEINKRINNIEADLTEVMRVLKTNNLLP
ncbi:helix-turn-helix domain-containing protein [uncultured Mucilaginibacter sp.]|uniref:XRE family transcriptional regulator n=1 Tax=uncultured Mucilaginibacter sp. TaxID=797541 RepID=UPI0025E7FC05|nr:helix-turn-helix domain-containing protein [uncultured Mucilaginibacter sp.]